ncbi:glycosyltransferase family 9 protein [Corynebacterium variabile]|uniref:glycosyltransferase family 9 protein n=1 Tax=Corynebacterium variabile TaxID=1727 RepID=UPI0028A1CBA0|nr:glycosyltransferase family 9 protein [Corynebacterium variabile]
MVIRTIRASTGPDAAPVLLALRALKLGDLLVAVPALRGLRRSFPDHRFILACPDWLSPVARLIGGVDALLHTPGLDQPLSVPSDLVSSVDVAVNLHGNGAESRGALEALETRVRIGHRAPGWDGPEWRDGIHERDRWARLVRAHGIPADPEDLHLARPARGAGAAGRTAIVHVGAGYASRHWPVERFAQVVDHLVSCGRRVILTGSAVERPRALQVAGLTTGGGTGAVEVAAGELALTGFLSAVASAEVVVSVDTGAAHLASAFGRPSVVIFGPAPPEEWGPPPGPHRVLTDATVRRGDVFADRPDPALLAVDVEDVLGALDTLPWTDACSTFEIK